MLPKCAIQLLSNGHERCTCIYIAQLWHEEHVCSKVMTRADMEHKDMCNTTFKMMMRMTGVLEVDVLGTTSSQGLIKYLHQQQCVSHTHTTTAHLCRLHVKVLSMQDASPYDMFTCLLR